MFNSILIENFKCLRQFEKPLGALTLLTGLNAAGKSSVVQSIAMLRQTAIDSEWSKSIHLNGSSVNLGTMYDVIDRNSGGSGFRVALETEDIRCQWETTSQDRKRELTAALDSITTVVGGHVTRWERDEIERGLVRRLVPQQIEHVVSGILDELREQIASICHVGAERLGPREVYVAHTPLTYPDVGSFGEKTPWCLDQFEDNEINPGLKLHGVPTDVRNTVEAWMSQLFPGFKLDLQRVDRANLLTMGIRTSPRGDFFRPSNVGFGITHVLPIFTACIAALPGRMVLVENPETHLHPAGQSLAGYFLALAASQGVQILVETHSDHVLNGIRRAVRDSRIAPEDLKVYFFSNEEDLAGETNTVVADVVVDANGRIMNWPNGFFDQLEADLDYISGV